MTTQPTRDEKAKAAAVRLQIATGWYPTVAADNRVVLRLTITDTDDLIDDLNTAKRVEALVDQSEFRTTGELVDWVTELITGTPAT